MLVDRDVNRVAAISGGRHGRQFQDEQSEGGCKDKGGVHKILHCLGTEPDCNVGYKCKNGEEF